MKNDEDSEERAMLISLGHLLMGLENMEESMNEFQDEFQAYAMSVKEIQEKSPSFYYFMIGTYGTHKKRIVENRKAEIKRNKELEQKRGLEERRKEGSPANG